jgi:GR25 family glycosyltransferase involved in LPS biosynthesis
MSDWPILVINLERSPERLEHMVAMLPTFTRIEGVDGRPWQAPGEDATGRPLWNFADMEALKDSGVMGDVHWFPLIPTEIGCALGHRAAWQHIVDNEIPCTVVLEDDIDLTEHFHNTFEESVGLQGGFPADADVLFLQGRDAAYPNMSTDSQGHLTYGGGNYGYVITLEGARKALKAQFPMYYPCDVQWWSVCFKDYKQDFGTLVPGIAKGYAYVVEHAIVKIALIGEKSTMTEDGTKPWRRMN